MCSPTMSVLSASTNRLASTPKESCATNSSATNNSSIWCSWQFLKTSGGPCTAAVPPCSKPRRNHRIVRPEPNSGRHNRNHRKDMATNTLQHSTGAARLLSADDAGDFQLWDSLVDAAAVPDVYYRPGYAR